MQLLRTSGAAVIEDEHRAVDAPPPVANDDDHGGPRARVNAAAMTIARLIGRQMAREALEQLDAQNDNDPPERYGE